MRWREVKANVWTVPAERFKSDSEHIVPLSDVALTVLSEMPRLKRGDYGSTSPPADSSLMTANRRAARLRE